MIHFSGCSFTMGAGYPGEQQNPAIYPNLIGAILKEQVNNHAEGGSSNLKIFTKTAKALLDQSFSPHSRYFVQWSALHRHWVYPSPKHGVYIGGKVDDNILDRNFVAQYQLLNHDYSNIMSLIDYTRILTQMAKNANTDIWFINGLLPWTEDILHGTEPSEYTQSLYTDLTKDEIKDFSTRLKDNLELVDWKQWINPWTSMANMTSNKDFAPLDNHPGPATHQKLADMILQHIK